MQKKMESHKHFPWLWKAVFVGLRLVVCILSSVGAWGIYTWSKAIATKEKIVARNQTRANQKIDRLIAADKDASKINEKVAEDLRDRFKNAQAKTAKMGQENPVPIFSKRARAEEEALKIWEDNFAKNDLIPEPKTPQEYTIPSGSNIAEHLENFFSEKSDAQLPVDSKAPAPILLLTDQTAAINDSGVSDAEVEAVLIAKAKASAEAAAASGPVINLPDNSTQELPKEEIAEPEILAVVDETPVIIDGEKIVVDEKPASVKVDPEAPIVSEKAPEPKATKAEIIPPKIAKAAIPETEIFDKEIEDLVGEIQNPKTTATSEEKMNFLNHLKQLLGMKKSLCKSARAKAVFEESVISAMTAARANYDKLAAEMDAETIKKEKMNLTEIPMLLEEKMRIAELRLGYAIKLEETYSNKRLKSQNFLTADNLRTNAK